MQVLNLTDGTAEPIKSLSEIDIGDEGKMSDRDLTALILTIKGCRDCLRLSRQLDYRAVDIVRVMEIDHIDRCVFSKSIYWCSTIFETGITTFFKDIQIKCDNPDLIIDHEEGMPIRFHAQSIMPGDRAIISKDSSLTTVDKMWINPPDDGLLYLNIKSSVPVKLPIKLQLSYKSSSLPIPFPEKYIVKNEKGIWIFSRLNDGAEYGKSEVVKL